MVLQCYGLCCEAMVLIERHWNLYMYKYHNFQGIWINVHAKYVISMTLVPAEVMWCLSIQHPPVCLCVCFDIERASVPSLVSTVSQKSHLIAINFHVFFCILHISYVFPIKFQKYWKLKKVMHGCIRPEASCNCTLCWALPCI